MPAVSVIIIAKNEEANIKACLDSVSWADEIILVDGESADRTVAIAARYPRVRVFRHKMQNGFGPEKQYALSLSSHAWVLSLDADERITPECAREIQDQVALNKYDGYRFRMKNYMFNRYICDRETAALRLFKKEKARFTNVRAHESVVLRDGKTGVIKEPILHHSTRMKNIENSVAAVNFCSSLSVLDLQAKGKKVTFCTAPIYFIGYPGYVFFRQFILNGHWRDGWPGFLMALMRAVEALLNYAKLCELQMRDGRTSAPNE